MTALRCTCGKYCYPKAKARQVAVMVSRERGQTVTAYKCPTVGSVWHIGHPNPNSDPAASREERREAQARKNERLGRTG